MTDSNQLLNHSAMSDSDTRPGEDAATQTREAEDKLLETVCWTPTQALSSGYFILNVCIAACINFSINGGINYALMNKYDYGGLWEVPRTPHPYTSSVLAFDLFLTSFLVVFFTTLLTCGGIQNEIKKGTIKPVTDDMLRNSNWRYFPTRFKRPLARAFLMGVQYSIVYYGFTLLLLSTVCLAGGMGGEGNVCAIRTHIYPWIKGCWALTLAVLCWPSAFLGHINKNNLPQDVYDLFLGRTKLEQPDLFAKRNPDGTLAVVPSGPTAINGSGAHAANGIFDTSISITPSVGSSVAGSAPMYNSQGTSPYGFVPLVGNDPNAIQNNGNTTSGTYAQPPVVKRDRAYYERRRK